jgi:hypothetical protein
VPGTLEQRLEALSDRIHQDECLGLVQKAILVDWDVLHALIRARDKWRETQKNRRKYEYTE